MDVNLGILNFIHLFVNRLFVLLFCFYISNTYIHTYNACIYIRSCCYCLLFFNMAPGAPSKIKSTDTKAASKSGPKTWICPICDVNIGRGIYSIGCAGCHSFFHPKCIGLSSTDLKGNKSLRYTCGTCRSARSTNTSDLTFDSTKCNASTAQRSSTDCSPSSGIANTVPITNSSPADVAVVDSSSVMQTWFDRNNSIMQKWFDDLTTSMRKSIDEQMRKYSEEFQAIVDSVVSSFRNEFMDGLRKAKDDINSCKEDVSLVNDSLRVINDEIINCKLAVTRVESLYQRVEYLEKKNNVLERRLNRANIVVNGLPRGRRDISKDFLTIASLCNVRINPTDLQHCCYFRNGRSILVKLNSVLTRDLIMANYHRGNPIKVSDVIGGNLGSKVYLNDHLTPDAVALVNACRTLVTKKILIKYKLVNGDMPYVIATFSNGSENSLYLRECEQLIGAPPLINMRGSTTPVSAASSAVN